MSANTQERKQTLVIRESGLQVKVQQDRLVIAKQQTILHCFRRGQQDVGCILFLSSSSADIHLDALTWCSQERICLLLQRSDGLGFWSLTTSICESVDSTTPTR